MIGDSGRASPVLPDDSVAVFADVVKEFRRGSERVNLRAALPWSRRGPVPERQPQHLAVDCVSMSLRRGEALGVVGPNGAGKSTLLRLLGGITLPTSGEVWTRGRIASLIELGVGFHPDLTGRENIWYTAAVHGMARRELAHRYEEIVTFAGLDDDAMGTPVKRYSSGMLARLGFAVAAHVDADILAVDEVLAVGDAEFQRRSFERMRALRDEGAAIAFVSHDLWMVAQICDRAVALDHGRIVDHGPAAEVVERYGGAGVAGGGVWGRAPVQLEGFQLEPDTIASGGGFSVETTMVVRAAAPGASVHLTIQTAHGVVVVDSQIDSARDAVSAPGRYRLSGEIFSFPMSPGDYNLELSVFEGDDRRSCLGRVAGAFSVAGTPGSGTLRLHADWRVAAEIAPE